MSGEVLEVEEGNVSEWVKLGWVGLGGDGREGRGVSGKR